MAKPKYSEFKRHWNNLRLHPKRDTIAAIYGVTPQAISLWARDFTREGYKGLIDRSSGNREGPIDAEQLILEDRLRKEIKLQRKQIQHLTEQVHELDHIKSIIHDTKRLMPTNPKPIWLTKERPSKRFTGIPMLFISDVHFDEYVDGSQINNVNQYNRKIAVKRIKNTFIRTNKILLNYLDNPKYEGIVVALGGDMLSGNIHEELRRSNEAPITKSIFDLTELLAECLSGMADLFGKVHVPCVVGNHGRLDKKPPMKNKVHDNYEWLVYQFLAKELKNDKRITFQIPDGPDAIFNIYDITFLLTHGDQFKGGSGISGIHTPLALGRHRKQAKQQAIKDAFDVMMVGHFHQYIHMNNLIVNGSIKGYDEFANIYNFPYEPAQQALCIVNPVLGITFRTPVLCDDPDKNLGKSKTGLSVFST